MAKEVTEAFRCLCKTMSEVARVAKVAAEAIAYLGSNFESIVCEDKIKPISKRVLHLAKRGYGRTKKKNINRINKAIELRYKRGCGTKAYI